MFQCRLDFKVNQYRTDRDLSLNVMSNKITHTICLVKSLILNFLFLNLVFWSQNLQTSILTFCFLSDLGQHAFKNIVFVGPFGASGPGEALPWVKCSCCQKGNKIQFSTQQNQCACTCRKYFHIKSVNC